MKTFTIFNDLRKFQPQARLSLLAFLIVLFNAGFSNLLLNNRAAQPSCCAADLEFNPNCPVLLQRSNVITSPSTNSVPSNNTNFPLPKNSAPPPSKGNAFEVSFHQLSGFKMEIPADLAMNEKKSEWADQQVNALIPPA